MLGTMRGDAPIETDSFSNYIAEIAHDQRNWFIFKQINNMLFTILWSQTVTTKHASSLKIQFNFTHAGISNSRRVCRLYLYWPPGPGVVVGVVLGEPLAKHETQAMGLAMARREREGGKDLLRRSSKGPVGADRAAERSRLGTGSKGEVLPHIRSIAAHISQ